MANKTDCLGTNGGCLRWKSSFAWKSAQHIRAEAASDKRCGPSSGRWVPLPRPCGAGQAGWAAGTGAELRHHPGVVLRSPSDLPAVPPCVTTGMQAPGSEQCIPRTEAGSRERLLLGAQDAATSSAYFCL